MIMNRNISTITWQYSRESLSKYINDATEILAKYSWIYNVRNTHILLEDVLERIPLEWCEALVVLPWEELKYVPFCFVKDDWPATLKSFIEECCHLGDMRYPQMNLQSFIAKMYPMKWTIEKKTPIKKQDEIKMMSYLISEVSKTVMCDTVLDVGSGLGYLDETLHHNFGLKCIGLDSAISRTTAAEKRLKKDPCKKSIHYETIAVENTDECLKKIRTLAKSFDNALECACQKHGYCKGDESSSVIMTGLHCCGNLMQDMMKLFCHMDELKAFVCIGCCYNKIPLNQFPMSKTAAKAIHIMHASYPSWSPCISGLRLGSQGTRSELLSVTEEMLACRLKAKMFRAVLESYTENEKIQWQKHKKRIKLSEITDFETYCKNLLEDDLTGETEFRLRELKAVYSKNEYLFPKIRILLILQILLQPVWECFVTVDRMLYFEENSISTEVFSMWDDLNSPRNIALCGYKR